jgi:hypothetical protein
MARAKLVVGTTISPSTDLAIISFFEHYDARDTNIFCLDFTADYFDVFASAFSTSSSSDC